jgi:hypothetical protein
VKISILAISILFSACADSDFSGTTATNKSKSTKTKDSPVETQGEGEEIETDENEEKKEKDLDKLDPDSEKPLNESTGDLSAFVCADRSYRINNQCVDAVPVYHWENTLTNKHLYTLTATESCQRSYGWPALTRVLVNSKRIYRYFLLKSGGHPCRKIYSMLVSMSTTNRFMSRFYAEFRMISKSSSVPQI